MLTAFHGSAARRGTVHDLTEQGASLKDPSGLFNSSLEGDTRRAIDIHEDDEIDEKAFSNLIKAAVSLNEASSR